SSQLHANAFPANCERNVTYLQRRRNSGLASYWAGHRKISVVSVDRMPTINEVLIEDNVSITKGLPEETWSGKTFVVRNASPES
ncbi:hypothetical protein MRX96_046061, partial [Rhipicephalus microplus]